MCRWLVLCLPQARSDDTISSLQIEQVTIMASPISLGQLSYKKNISGHSKTSCFHGFLTDLTCNPMHVNSEISPILLNDLYSQERVLVFWQNTCAF